MVKVVKKRMQAAIAAIASFSVFGAPYLVAHADTITLTDPLGGSETFTSVATAVAGFLFWDVAAPLSVIMVLVGAFQLITSSGDPEKVSKGRKTILYAAVGLLIALLAGGVVSIIRSFTSGGAS